MAAAPRSRRALRGSGGDELGAGRCGVWGQWGLRGWPSTMAAAPLFPRASRGSGGAEGGSEEVRGRPGGYGCSSPFLQGIKALRWGWGAGRWAGGSTVASSASEGATGPLRQPHGPARAAGSRLHASIFNPRRPGREATAAARAVQGAGPGQRQRARLLRVCGAGGAAGLGHRWAWAHCWVHCMLAMLALGLTCLCATVLVWVLVHTCKCLCQSHPPTHQPNQPAPPPAHTARHPAAVLPCAEMR